MLTITALQVLFLSKKCTKRRPREKRLKSSVEQAVSRKKQRSVCCSICGESGHNRKRHDMVQAQAKENINGTLSGNPVLQQKDGNAGGESECF